MRIHHPVFFLSKKEKEKIVTAIREAEKNTSGEIRVHLGSKVRGDVFGHAKRIFQKIGMSRTVRRNGVLIFLAVRDRKFAVIGDTGIDEKVPEGFWNDVAEILWRHFKEDHFAEGIAEAVLRIGMKLREFFPSSQDDTNELSDSISH
ncbi:MAG: TPM domain-containing protein [Candidatus Omnitrophica bacterium]|nr:TPM domain-containing protein [Candidatus Omnitrophota bacterium]